MALEKGGAAKEAEDKIAYQADDKRFLGNYNRTILYLKRSLLARDFGICMSREAVNDLIVERGCAMGRLGKSTCVFATLIGTLAFTTSSFAASQFQGVWKVKDTFGKSFEITLLPDGNAKGTLVPMMVGSWKEEGNAAVIKWDTFWTTKIMKEGNHYTKIAYRRNESMTAPPYNRSDAEKEK